MLSIEESVLCAVSATKNNEINLTIFTKGKAHSIVLPKEMAKILSDEITRYIQLWS